MSISKIYRNTIRHTFLCLHTLSCLLRVTAISYTTLDEKTFFYIPYSNSSHFFSLDLTRSWNTTKPALQSLPAVPSPLLPIPLPHSDFPISQGAPLVVNYDKTSLIYFDSNRTPSVYNITTKKWRPGTRLSDTDKDRSSVYSFQVATDPSTGIAYIPTFDNTNDFPMYTYNTFQGYTTNVTKTFIPGVPKGYSEYSAVWSTVRKSVLFFGGNMIVKNRLKFPGLMEYQPSTNQWIKFRTQESSAGGASDACMASAYNGTKILMVGSTGGPQYLQILDVETLVWTDGAEVDQYRARVSCTAVGDYLIVTGGESFNAKKPKEVSVYNIRLDEWTDTYEPPQTPTMSTGVTTASPVAEQGRSSGEGMPLRAKIGIIAGASSALVILLICGALLILRRKLRRSSHADVIDEDLLISNLGRTEKDRNHPNNSVYPSENMDTSSSTGLDQEHKYAASPYFNKSALEPSQNPQLQHWFPHSALHEVPSPYPDGQSRKQGARSPQNQSSNASSPSLDGLLRPQAERMTSSIPAATIQQWLCAQQRENSQYRQYIPLPPSILATPALVHYPRCNLEDHHGGYHGHSDCRAINRNQRRDHPQDDRDRHNHTVDYNATYYERHANDPQACYRDPNDAEDYHEMYQDPRMTASQEHGHSSTGDDLLFSNNQRRLDPQDPTRHSTASRLEFYQSRRLNNPQDHGDQDGQDDDTLYQDIQCIRAQQEEHKRQRQELERVRLEKESILHTRAGLVKYDLPQEQH